MINTSEILETLRMIDQEKLDVRLPEDAMAFCSAPSGQAPTAPGHE